MFLIPHEKCNSIALSNLLGKKESTFYSLSAFSLLEMLLVIVLLATGIGSLLRVFGMGLFADVNIENNITALNLTQEKMEEIKNSSFSAISNESRAANEAELGAFATDFDREVVVADIASDFKQVDVNVYWSEKGQEISLGLSTYITDY